MSEEVEIKSQIKMLDELISALQIRRSELARALEDLKHANEADVLKFDVAVDESSSLVRWLESKVLKPHSEKYGLRYEFKKVDNKIIAVKLSNSSNEHRREIENAVKWVCKKYAEKGG